MKFCSRVYSLMKSNFQGLHYFRFRTKNCFGYPLVFSVSLFCYRALAVAPFPENTWRKNNLSKILSKSYLLQKKGSAFCVKFTSTIHGILCTPFQICTETQRIFFHPKVHFLTPECTNVFLKMNFWFWIQRLKALHPSPVCVSLTD